MNKVKPYEPASLPLDRPPRLNTVFRVTRAAMLGAIGCGVYLAGVRLIPAAVDDSNWVWRAGTIAFGFATSEIFAIEEWSLRKNLFRRLIISCSITIVSVVVGGSLCTLAGVEMLRSRTPIMLLRLHGIAILVSVALTWIFLRLPSRVK